MAGISVHDDRNQCSASVGIGVHLRPEWLFMMGRNTHSSKKLHYILNDVCADRPYSHQGVQLVRVDASKNSGIAGHWTHSGSGILIEDASDVRVRYTRTSNNGFACDSGVGGPCGLWAANSRRVRFEHCVSSHNRTAGDLDGGGFDFDGGVTDSLIKHCVAHSNMGAGIMLYNYRGAAYPFGNNLVVNNVCINNGSTTEYGDLHIDGTAADSAIIDNVVTACDSASPLLVIAGTTDGITCTDNVLRSHASRIAFTITGRHRNLAFARNPVFATGGEPVVVFLGGALPNANAFERLWNAR